MNIKHRFWILGLLAVGFAVTTPAWAAQGYTAKVEQELKEWSDRLVKLQADSEQLGAETRARTQAGREAFEAKLVAAKRLFSDLEHSGQIQGRSFRQKLNQALREVRQSYRQATAAKEK